MDVDQKKLSESREKYGKSQITRITFIEDLKFGDDAIWAKFYDKYADLILNFAMKRGCSSQLAEDVLQETVMTLIRYIPNFKYEKNKGRFRSFLFKITESKIVDAFRRNKRLTTMENAEILRKDTSDSITPADEVEKIWDNLWEENILAEAVADIKTRVNDKSFACFEKVFLNEQSVKNTAKELGISVNLVSQHKHRILKLIIEKAKELRSQYGE